MSLRCEITGLRPWAATVLLVVATCAAPVQASGVQDDIIGEWKLTKVLDSSQISSIDDRQAARLVGQILVVRPDKVILAGETCEKPDFERHYEDTVRYLREEAHASAGRLGLPTTVAVIDLACTEALLKGYDKIVVYWKGFFFDAVRHMPAEGRRP